MVSPIRRSDPGQIAYSHDGRTIMTGLEADWEVYQDWLDYQREQQEDDE